MVCLNRTYHFKFFKCCLSLSLFGKFLKTLNQILLVVTLAILKKMRQSLVSPDKGPGIDAARPNYFELQYSYGRTQLHNQISSLWFIK